MSRCAATPASRYRGALAYGVFASVLSALSVGLVPTPVAAQESHLLVIRGISGDPAYAERFHEWSSLLVAAAVESGVDPSNITYLAEDPSAFPGVDGESRKEEVESAFAALTTRMSDGDHLTVVLIGHGSYRDGEARFNLPGPDLSAPDFGGLLDQIPGTVAFVNASSASGGFTQALSAPERVVITATREGERNLSRFGEHFAAAYNGAAADLDKNGRVSLLEAFEYARREVTRSYESTNNLVSEHASLDDNGDGKGSDDAGTTGDALDGAVARRTFLGPGRIATATTAEGPAAADSVGQRLIRERNALEDRIARLRERRELMEPDEYQAQLEDLLVELGLKNREIRERGGS